MTETCQTWGAALQAHNVVFAVSDGLQLALLVVVLYLLIERRRP